MVRTHVCASTPTPQQVNRSRISTLPLSSIHTQLLIFLVVKLILELGPSSIHGQDGKGNTALHTAARRGCLKVATELMRFDKEVIYVRNKNGETPLHLGVIGSKQPLPKLIMKQGGQIEVVKQILVCNNHNVPEYVNWKTNEGHTALHLSVMSARIDDKLVALLLQIPGINVLETDKKGLTALDLAQACRESFPVAEFRCNIAISLLNTAVSSSSTATAAAGRHSTESRSSEKRNWARRSLSADWTTDFQTSRSCKAAPTVSDANANDRQHVETNAMPDENNLSRNLAVLRQTSVGIFETRKSPNIGTPSPTQCLSALQSLFSTRTFRRATLSGDSEWAPPLHGKKWNKFRKYMSVQNSSPQSLRQQFSSTANVLFHPNTPMESIELRQEVAPSISVSPFASPTGSNNQSPSFSSPSYIKSWLKSAIVQTPSSSSSKSLSPSKWSKRQRMKKRLKQIASMTHLSFSSASEIHSINDQQVNGTHPYLRRRVVAQDGSTAARSSAHDLGIPLIQGTLLRQSSVHSYLECYHPCFCLDNWCQDGQQSAEVQRKEGKTQARTVVVQTAQFSEGAASSAAHVLPSSLITRSQSSRSYKPLESPTAMDHIGTPALHGDHQGSNALPRRSRGSSPTTSPRPSASLSLSPWLSPTLRAARQKMAVPITGGEDGNSEAASSLEPEKDSQSIAVQAASSQGMQDLSVHDSPMCSAASQQSKLAARQDSFSFCTCGPCFQDGDEETDTHTRARGRQRVYHT